MLGEPVYFYRRSLELRAGVAQYVVYAVTPVPREKPDPVPVAAGFPENWRPVGELGMCLFERGRPAGLYETVAVRSQLRHATRISKAEALALYPLLHVQQQRAEYLPAVRLSPPNADPR